MTEPQVIPVWWRYVGEVDLDMALDFEKAWVSERRDSFVHIMTTFAAESAITKRELAFHLLVPHALKALPEVPSV